MYDFDKETATCDKCKKTISTYDDNEWGHIALIFPDNNTEWDLCPECGKEELAEMQKRMGDSGHEPVFYD